MNFSDIDASLLVRGLPYVILTVLSARQFIHTPDQSRFHATLIFASAACSILLAEASIDLFALEPLGAVASLLLRLSLVSGLLSMYAVFLLMADATIAYSWPGWRIVGLLLLSIAFTLAAPASIFSLTLFGLVMRLPLLQSIILSVLLVGYLIVTIHFWRQSSLTSGALRSRLQWIGTSVALLFCAGALGLASLSSPAGEGALTWVKDLLLIMAGVILYGGAVPPPWLRRRWMYPELERISHLTSALIVRPSALDVPANEQNQPTILSAMLHSAINGLGARGGVLQLWSEQARALEVAVSISPPGQALAAEVKSAAQNEVLAEAFNTRRALLRSTHTRPHLLPRRRLAMSTTLAAPLVLNEQALGVLGLYHTGAFRLNETDLSRLQLFADQMALWLRCQQQQQETASLVEARAQQALKDEFIALIAHDLRTPLTVLKGRLQLLRRQLSREGHEAAADAVAKLDAPFNRLNQLITTLLDVSHIDTGRLQLIRHAVDLPGLVRKVVEEASQGRAIELEVGRFSGSEEGKAARESQPMIVSADASRLEQVLMNLLDNARKYSPLASPITVRVEHRVESHEALVSVHDRGIGIPPEDQPRLFQRWFRAANNSSQHYGGVGLGLYISHEVITRHSGRLWVESSGIPGEGSTFFFTLPLLDPRQLAEGSSMLTEIPAPNQEE